VTETGADPPFDIKERVKQITQPLVDSLDARLRKQIDQRVDERLVEQVDAALRDRLAVIERALADLDRSVRELRERLDAS